jgi:hypothetical protein
MEKQSNPQVIEGFRKRKGRQLIVTIPIFAAVFLMAMTDGSEDAIMGIPGNILFPISIAIIVAGVAFSIFNWRCPACNGYMGKGFNPKFCTKCGEQLQ